MRYPTQSLMVTGKPCANGETVEWVLTVGDPLPGHEPLASLFANGDPDSSNYINPNEATRRLLATAVREAVIAPLVKQ